MGSFLSRLFFSQIISYKHSKIVILGLDNAGKTATLYKIGLNENVTTVPTVGFNCETIQYNNVRMLIFDLGGQAKIRQVWQHYLENTDAIIYVVDSADPTNKQDLSEALPASQIAEELNLKSIKQDYHLQDCSAITGKGLYEGFDWLSGKIA
ncbi:hypothetical protein C9374_004373 [Naegleria lovaniensis]|uniref:Uncharacterized protein n=1 Tax=Naegleria lovaniensis TaxID=51637 RepID=A0AA88KK13_NAELO|nr:uncharacterized protein C9374_004373 [Naegleria lovaniensis]KAG2383702.1 hypothetical protein C9374_004373 [Naegleria lovaniensis]